MWFKEWGISSRSGLRNLKTLAFINPITLPNFSKKSPFQQIPLFQRRLGDFSGRVISN